VRGLAGRAFLVTGGGSGIGRATCEHLAAEGAAVAIVDRGAEQLGEVAAEIERSGGRTLSIAADVSCEAEAREAVERAARELGGLAGLVTSAGIFQPGDMRPLADVSLDTFEQTLAVNLTGTFLFVKHALPHLVRDGRGSIVTIASTAGLRGHGFGSGYTASKGGVIALTRLVALQYGDKGVRANCICPGATRTGMTRDVYEQPEFVARITARVPLARVAEAGEIGNLACYLLSDDASYVTGQIVAADGGATVM
jgi:NAD(P)-dependent dehydrogenase (short-subunit alcohol dehydrogenase family)